MCNIFVCACRIEVDRALYFSSSWHETIFTPQTLTVGAFGHLLDGWGLFSVQVSGNWETDLGVCRTMAGGDGTTVTATRCRGKQRKAVTSWVFSTNSGIMPYTTGRIAALYPRAAAETFTAAVHRTVR